MKHKALFLCLFLLFTKTYAQDTLRVRINQADSLFLKNNLYLLAEKYQIEMARAEVIQAGLWENPNVELEINAYNPDKRRAFDIGHGGQKILTVQQMLFTAGKRNKQVALAAEGVRMSEFQFYDLIRTLKFQLREAFFESYFLEQSLNILDSQITTLQATIDAFEREYGRNNVSLKEVVRLKALRFQLTNNRASIQFELADNQKNLRDLFHLDAYIVPVVDSTMLQRYRYDANDAESLKNRALQSRADLKVAQSLTQQAELNYKLQKALAVPNVTVGALYDQQGSYINNYTGLTVSMDLPFFNKNQGNIKSAKNQIDFQRTTETARQESAKREVMAALTKVLAAEKAYQGVETRFSSQFEELNRGIYENFQKGNITLIEFIDFIESYNDSILEYNRLQSNRISAYEELNFSVGEEIFN